MSPQSREERYGRRRREKKSRRSRSHKRSTENAGGGAKCSEWAGRQGWCHHSVSDDSARVISGAEGSMRGAGREAGGGRQRQKTEHSFLKLERKEELGLCETAQQDLELLLRKKRFLNPRGILMEN